MYHDLKSSATMSTGMRLDARMSTASPKAAMVGYEVGADQVVAARLMHSLTEYSSGRPFVPVWRRYSSADRNGVRIRRAAAMSMSAAWPGYMTLGGKTFWYTCMWQCFGTAIGWASLCRAPPCVSQSHPYGVYHTPSMFPEEKALQTNSSPY